MYISILQVIDIQPRYNDLNIHTVSIITGRILSFHAHESVLTDDSIANPERHCPIIDYTKLQPVGRLGGNTYTVVKEGIDLYRPKIKKT